MADPLTAVIAEDDPDTRDLIEIVLAQSGFTTILAPDGASALEAIREHRPLLTTLDVNMPGMDGFAVAKRLREFSQTYLIMITSLTQEVDVVRGLEAGADDYLVKPFRPRELRARADAMLRRASFGGVNGSSPAPATQPAPETWALAAAREFRADLQADDHDTERTSAATAPPARPEPAPAASSAPAFVSAPPEPPTPSGSPYVPAHAAVVTAEPVPVPQAIQPTFSQAPAPAVVHEEAAVVEGAVIRYGGLVLDTATGAVTVGNRRVDLGAVELELLVSLLRTGRRVRSKADLVLAIRGQQYVTSHFVNEADKQALEGHIANLNAKLGDNPSYIEVVRGVGFRLALLP